MGEDDMKVFKKDRVKKDNHNMSELNNYVPFWPPDCITSVMATIANL